MGRNARLLNYLPLIPQVKRSDSMKLLLFVFLLVFLLACSIGSKDMNLANEQLELAG